MRSLFRDSSSQAGFTLLEILIAVLVLSIGVLGVAGMQISGLRGNQSSLQRGQAATLAYEIADRMRANPTAARKGEYVVDIGAPGAPPPAAPATDCSSTSCTTDQLAASDLYDWGLRVNQTLPRSTWQIACNDAPCSGNSLQTVTLYWDQDRTGASGTACTDNPADDESTRDTQVNLSCVRIFVQP